MRIVFGVIMLTLLVLAGCASKEITGNTIIPDENEKEIKEQPVEQVDATPKILPKEKIEPEPIAEPIIEPEKVQEETTLSKKEISNNCDDLCFVNRIKYCTEDITLTLDSGLTTIGNCRVFSKYVNGFAKCKGFCQSYGDEKGCTLENGKKDNNCDGKV